MKTGYIIFSILLLLLAWGCRRGENGTAFENGPEELLSSLTEEDHLLTYDEFSGLLSGDREGIRIIDIRQRSEYEQGHVDGALNIPAQDLLEEATLDLIAQDTVTHVLYGENHLQVNGPWMLLNSLGYEGVKVYPGGYPLDSVWTGTGMAGYDYASLYGEAVERNRKEEEAAKPKVVAPPRPKVVAPKPKPRPVEKEEEGC